VLPCEDVAAVNACIRGGVIAICASIYGAWVSVLLWPQNTGRFSVPIAVACALGAVVAGVADHRVHVEFGSVERISAYRESLRKSELPSDIDAAQWARWPPTASMANGVATSGGLLFASFGLLSAMVSQSPHRWLALAVFGVLFVWVVVAVPVRVARSKTLLAVARRRALAARASTGASDPVRDAIGRRRSDAPPCEAGDPAESNPL
jgi:heme exporter protein D